MTQETENGYHFHVMRRAIDLIDAAAETDPGVIPLDRLASEMNMSPEHFQKVFTAWAGVSPKRYQQYLALGQAKTLLAARGGCMICSCAGTR